MGQAASTYAYDPEDRLVSITYGGGGGVTYAYDALGRQVARATGGVTTSYYYDGDSVIDEYNGTSYAQYTWGPSGQVRRGSEFTMYDGLGSVTKITDGSGTPSEQITLDAFGRTQNIGGTSSDPYQYKSEYGYRTDGDGNTDGQGIMKVGARYYDPLFGRFITRDKDLTQAAYAYCSGDPVNSVDPSGHEPKTKTTYNYDPATGNFTETTTTTYSDGTVCSETDTYNMDGTITLGPCIVTSPSSSGNNISDALDIEANEYSYAATGTGGIAGVCATTGVGEGIVPLATLYACASGAMAGFSHFEASIFRYFGH